MAALIDFLGTDVGKTNRLIRDVDGAAVRFMCVDVFRPDPAEVSNVGFCPICHENFDECATKAVQFKACKHIFCAADVWTHVSGSHANARQCPMCRATLFARDGSIATLHDDGQGQVTVSYGMRQVSGSIANEDPWHRAAREWASRYMEPDAGVRDVLRGYFGEIEIIVELRRTVHRGQTPEDTSHVVKSAITQSVTAAMDLRRRGVRDRSGRQSSSATSVPMSL